MTQEGFQNDACSFALSANQITARQMRASSKHQFENPSQHVQVHV